MGLLTRVLEKRQSPENPQTPLSEAVDWLFAALGGVRTESGVAVSEFTALQFPPVWAAVRAIAETVASVPLITYRRLPRGKERALNHPNYSLLHDQPNPEMTSMQFRELMMGHVLTWGNAFAEIERDAGERVRALWPLLPDRTSAERVNGAKRYRTRLPDGREIMLSSARVLHIPGLGFDGLMGYSPIAYHRQTIGLGKAAELFGSLFFGQGANSRFIMRHPNTLTKEAYDRLKDSISQQSEGLSRAHRTMILEEGMQIDKLTIPPEDAQFLQTRKFQVTDIARIYRIPPHMIGDLERATFSNVEQQAIDFVVHTIRPWLVRAEMIYKVSLFGMNTPFFAEHLVDGLLRGDIASRFQAYNVGIQSGFLTRNEVREKENMNPIQGLDEPLVPLNMISATIPSPAPSDNSDTTPRALPSGNGHVNIGVAFQPLFTESIWKIVQRDCKEILKISRSSLRKGDLRAFIEAIDAFYAESPKFIRQLIARPLYAFSLALRPDVEPEAVVNEYAGIFERRYSQESLASLKALTHAATDDPLKALEECLSEWQSERPARMGFRETAHFATFMEMEERS